MQGNLDLIGSQQVIQGWTEAARFLLLLLLLRLPRHLGLFLKFGKPFEILRWHHHQYLLELLGIESFKRRLALLGRSIHHCPHLLLRQKLVHRGDSEEGLWGLILLDDLRRVHGSGFSLASIAGFSGICSG